MLGAALWVVVLTIVVGGVLFNRFSLQQSAQIMQRPRASLVQPYSPTFGNPDAKVHIVEFLDPACEACGSFYPYVKQIIASNPDRVRLSIRHVPLHEGSDYVVKVLEAARKQGKYWPTLEALFLSQADWVRNHTVQPEMVLRALERSSLNLEQVRVDMNDPEIIRRIDQDLEDAKRLQVTQTPEFFVNGRPLPSFGLEQLEKVVDEALKSSYR